MVMRKLKRFIGKYFLPSSDVEYYLSWAKFPSKIYRCWVNRNELSPALQDCVDTKKLHCEYK